MSSRRPRPPIDPSQSAAVLLPKLAKALKRPGISKEAVFKGRDDVYAYSIDPCLSVNARK